MTVAPLTSAAQTAETMATIADALAYFGATFDDVVYSKSFVTELDDLDGYRQSLIGALGTVRPTSTLLGVPALITPALKVEIEVDAILGAGANRQEVFATNERERAGMSGSKGDRIGITVTCTVIVRNSGGAA